MKPTFFKALVVVSCVALAACSSAPRNPHLDPTGAAVMPPLEVPPPLNVPAQGNEAVEVPGAVPQEPVVLPQPDNVRLERYGDSRWLVVKGTPEQVWSDARAFWGRENVEIKIENPTLGILETQWVENYAEIPEGFVRGVISKFAPKLYSAATRDKFRMRIERGVEPGTTEIYVAHYGVAEVDQDETAVWRVRPSDPELVTEMLVRLMHHLGTPVEQATAAVKEPASIPANRLPKVRRDADAIVMEENFARAWRHVGIAIDRVGFVVIDLNRAEGVYYVQAGATWQQEEEKGWFSSLFSEETAAVSQILRVHVTGDETSSRVNAEDEMGQPLAPDAADKVLTRLEEQLR